MMKLLPLYFLLCLSYLHADVKVEFVKFTEHTEELWELHVVIRNDGNDAVTLNTGYLQHGVSYNEDKKTGQFYLLTDNQSSSGYKLVPSIDEMKLVTLKGLQYCKIAYKFRPDDEDKEMLELIKRGIRIRVTYSSKDRGFAYAYWKGRISSLNFISLESE